MIFAYELQIGNYVRHKGNIKKITSFDQYGINPKPVIDYNLDFGKYVIDMNYEALLDDLRPVDIDSRILGKCGFILAPSTGPNDSPAFSLQLPTPVNGIKSEIFFFMSHVPEVQPYGHIRVLKSAIDKTNTRLQ